MQSTGVVKGALALCVLVSFSRAAVGMGIPMGIPMGMGMVWVWDCDESPWVLWVICGIFNGCNFRGIETNSTNSEFVFS